MTVTQNGKSFVVNYGTGACDSVITFTKGKLTYDVYVGTGANLPPKTTTNETGTTPSENKFTLVSEGTFIVNPFYMQLLTKSNYFQVYFTGTYGKNITLGSFIFPKGAKTGTYKVNPAALMGVGIAADEVNVAFGNNTFQFIGQSGTVDLTVNGNSYVVICNNIPTIQTNDITKTSTLSGYFSIN